MRSGLELVAVVALLGGLAACARGEPITAAELPVPDVPWCEHFRFLGEPSHAGAYARRHERRFGGAEGQWLVDELISDLLGPAAPGQPVSQRQLELDAEGRVLRRRVVDREAFLETTQLLGDDGTVVELVEESSRVGDWSRRYRRTWVDHRLASSRSYAGPTDGWGVYEYDAAGRLVRVYGEFQDITVYRDETTYHRDETGQLGAVETHTWQDGVWSERSIATPIDETHYVWARHFDDDDQPKYSGIVDEPLEARIPVTQPPSPTVPEDWPRRPDLPTPLGLPTQARLRAVFDAMGRVVELVDEDAPERVLRNAWSPDGVLLSQEVVVFVETEGGDEDERVIERAVYRCTEPIEGAMYPK